jgi:hypothetical protein
MITSEINALTKEELSSSYTLKGIIIKHGLNGVIHNYVMNNLLRVIDDKSLREDYLRKIGLEIENKKLFVLPTLIEKYGLFIPNIRLLDTHDLQQRFALFTENSGNKLVLLYTKHLGEARTINDSFRLKKLTEATDELVNFEWKLEDLSNKLIVAKGAAFGKDIWDMCKIEYLSSASRISNCSDSIRDKPTIKMAAEILVTYYDAVVR